MWDLIVSVPDRCLPFYFTIIIFLQTLIIKLQETHKISFLSQL